MGNHDYHIGMAENDDHLNKSGAKVLSGRLDSLLTAWENP
jgi:hypothetical protein